MSPAEGSWVLLVRKPVAVLTWFSQCDWLIS